MPPTFSAKTKHEMDPLYPVIEPAGKIIEPLPKFSDGTACNVYYHRSTTDTVEDVLRPGWFNHMKETFRSGKQRSVLHLVSCYLGEIETGLVQIDLYLADAPSSFDGNVIMKPVTRFEPAKADKPKAA